jgi:hypothetical protein
MSGVTAGFHPGTGVNTWVKAITMQVGTGMRPTCFTLRLGPAARHSRSKQVTEAAWGCHAQEPNEGPSREAWGTITGTLQDNPLSGALQGSPTKSAPFGDSLARNLPKTRNLMANFRDEAPTPLAGVCHAVHCLSAYMTGRPESSEAATTVHTANINIQT